MKKIEIEINEITYDKVRALLILNSSIKSLTFSKIINEFLDVYLDHEIINTLNNTYKNNKNNASQKINDDELIQKEELPNFSYAEGIEDDYIENQKDSHLINKNNENEISEDFNYEDLVKDIPKKKGRINHLQEKELKVKVSDFDIYSLNLKS